MPAFDIASLKFDARGLIPAIAQGRDGEVLMLAWMNAESLAETLRTGDVTYWSRSRGELWRKGETSGHVQRLVELRLDCDRDCLLLDRRPDRPGLPHQPAELLLHRGAGRARGRADRAGGVLTAARDAAGPLVVG